MEKRQMLSQCKLISLHHATNNRTSTINQIKKFHQSHKNICPLTSAWSLSQPLTMTSGTLTSWYLLSFQLNFFFANLKKNPWTSPQLDLQVTHLPSPAIQSLLCWDLIWRKHSRGHLPPFLIWVLLNHLFPGLPQLMVEFAQRPPQFQKPAIASISSLLTPPFWATPWLRSRQTSLPPASPTCLVYRIFSQIWISDLKWCFKDIGLICKMFVFKCKNYNKIY